MVVRFALCVSARLRFTGQLCPSSACRHLLPVMTGRKTGAAASPFSLAPFTGRGCAERSGGGVRGLRGKAPATGETSP